MNEPHDPFRGESIVNIMEVEPPPVPMAMLGTMADAAVSPPLVKAPQGTIAEVLEWVGADMLRARVAYTAEMNGFKRKTLIARLEEMIHG